MPFSSFVYRANSGSNETSVCIFAFSDNGIYGGLETIISKLSAGFTFEKTSSGQSYKLYSVVWCSLLLVYLFFL